MADGLINSPVLLKKVGVDVGHKVADLGTGRQSEFIIDSAKIVGDAGKVYAVDIVKDILAAVEERAKSHGLGNVETVWTDLEKVGAAKAIVDGSLDEVLLITVLFFGTDKASMVKEADRMLKSGGKALIVDWKATPTPIGPPVEDRISKEDAKMLAEGAGWTLVEEVEVGAYHWGMIYSKA